MKTTKHAFASIKQLTHSPYFGILAIIASGALCGCAMAMSDEYFAIRIPMFFLAGSLNVVGVLRFIDEKPKASDDRHHTPDA